MSKIAFLPILSTARERYTYDRETGVFSRRDTGRTVGYLNGHGYIEIKVNGKRLLAHRLAWALVTGDEPPLEIDHRNGIKSDNRLTNLRAATHSENITNTAARAGSAAGVKGVSFDRQRNKWRAKIVVNGRVKMLGRFDKLSDAAATYEAASRQLHGDFSVFESR